MIAFGWGEWARDRASIETHGVDMTHGLKRLTARAWIGAAVLACALALPVLEAAAANVRVLTLRQAVVQCGGVPTGLVLGRGGRATLPWIDRARFGGCTLHLTYRYVGSNRIPRAFRGPAAFNALWRRGGRITIRTGRGASSTRTSNQLPPGMAFYLPPPGGRQYTLVLGLGRLDPVPGRLASATVSVLVRYNNRINVLYGAQGTVAMRSRFPVGAGAGAGPGRRGGGAGPAVRAFSIPSVIGMRIARARARIRDFGARNAFRVRVLNGAVTRNRARVGIVTDQRPPGGTHLRLGSTVTLYVAVLDVALTTVPRVIGLSTAQARLRIANANLISRVQTGNPCAGRIRFTSYRAYDVSYRECSALDGRVMAQRLPAGSEARRGQTMVIVVGRLPRTRPMPNLTRGNRIGLYWPEAAAAARRAGYVAQVSRVFRWNCRNYGTVIRQSLRRGVRRPWGSLIDLVLCADCLSWDDPGFHLGGPFQFNACSRNLRPFALRNLPLGRLTNSLAPGEFPHPRRVLSRGRR